MNIHCNPILIHNGLFLGVPHKWDARFRPQTFIELKDIYIYFFLNKIFFHFPKVIILTKFTCNNYIFYARKIIFINMCELYFYSQMYRIENSRTMCYKPNCYSCKTNQICFNMLKIFVVYMSENYFKLQLFELMYKLFCIR